MLFSLEEILYQISSVFLIPALGMIILALIYSLYALGALLCELYLKRQGKCRSELLAYSTETGAASDDLELWIMSKLELLRLTSRVAPMLGLVATLIPMGPALLAVTENDAATMGKNMVIAFAGVTLALIAASIAFMVLNIRRRWLLEEMRQIERSHMPAVKIGNE